MADQKISELTALTGANVADDDAIAIVDTSATETKKIVFSELKNALDTATGFVRITGDTMTGDLVLSGADVTFGDNDKAIFGAGSDLEVFHDGSASNIIDTGTGNFFICGSGAIHLMNPAQTEYYASFNDNGAVDLRYDNSIKLATTSTGIDVTGTVTADALNVSAASPNIDVTDTGTSHASQDFLTNSNAVRATIGVERSAGGGLFVGSSPYAAVFGTASSGATEFATNNNVRMTISSTGSVGIGTSSPDAKLKVVATGANLLVGFSGTQNYFDASENIFRNFSGSEAMRIDSSGNVGIGTSSPDNNSGYTALTMSNTSGSGGGQVYVKSSAATGVFGADNAGTGAKVILQTNTSHPIAFGTDGTERMRIDSNGAVVINNSGGDAQLYLGGTSGTSRMYLARSGLDSFLWNVSNGNMKFGTNDSERMRIDSSGNLLVGHTSAFGPIANGGSGVTATPDGQLFAGHAGPPLYVNREDSDGDIAVFRKDGSTVGSIGVATAGASDENLYISNGDTGLRFRYNDDSIVPSNNTGSFRDNAIDLGLSNARFKDLYLSGSIEIENGTGNVGVGKQALNSNTASENTAVGYQAGYSITTAGDNTFVGYQAGYLRTGTGNTIMGQYAGRDGTTGTDNTFVGRSSGYTVTSGSNNTILGRYNGNQGGLDIRTSSNNIVLSDGDGNPRGYFNSLGNFYVNNLDGSLTGSTGVILYANGGANYICNLTSTNQIHTYNNNNTTGAVYKIEFRQNNSAVGHIAAGSSSTAYNTTSDYRLKENVVDLTGATTRLKQLEPKRFNFILDADTTVDGFLAHEVQSVVPEAITGTHNEVDDDGNPVYQGIDQAKLVPLLVATIKELEARITALENA